jgi:ubiquinone/menaquinone biosynthesis C-methylase UbiE
MPDAAFEDPRLARLYDVLDDDRSDLDVYVALVEELVHGTGRVLDVGCGTGTLCCLLAARGHTVTGLDPAGAMLEVARAKDRAGEVTWVEGEVSALADEASYDVVVMTGNVAQVFVDDDDWLAALRRLRRCLAGGGALVFETRDPAAEAWLEWTPERSRGTVRVDGQGAESWYELVAVAPGLVTFRGHLLVDGDDLVSESTLRFRSRVEIESTLTAAGFGVEAVRDAPDRPGRELVFVARSA